MKNFANCASQTTEVFVTGIVRFMNNRKEIIWLAIIDFQFDVPNLDREKMRCLSA